MVGAILSFTNFPFTYGTNKCAAQYTPHVMRFMVNIYRMTIIKNIEKNTLNTKKNIFNLVILDSALEVYTHSKLVFKAYTCGLITKQGYMEL